MSHHETHLTRRSALKHIGAAAAAATAAATVLTPGQNASAVAAAAADTDPATGANTGGTGKLPRTPPESAGVSPQAILAFIDAVEQKVEGLHSFMLLRHGRVAAEGWWTPYAPQLPHVLFSLSKSFTSTAVGLAVHEGRLSVEDRVTSFFPDKLPQKIDKNLAAMRVKHLLSMSTGHDKDATGPMTAAEDGDWVRGFLSLPVEHAPGSKFVYNSAATYMCSAIVQKLTGKRMIDYLKPRLFEPLGIQGATWDTDPKGIDVGGWGLNVKTEDIARFGQLYLQKGKWGERQIVPAAWVEEATSKQVSNGDVSAASDWSQGYGYQFWRSRNNAYRGDGAFGQYCVVMPEKDAVLAITSGVPDMQAVLNAAWEHLLPGMGESAARGDTEALRQRLGKLEVRSPQGSRVSPAAAAKVSGKTYRLEANDEKLQSARFAFSPERCTLTLKGESGRERKIVSGHAGWAKGEAAGTNALPRLGSPPAGKVAARGAWTADDRYTIKVCYIETPFEETIECRFTGDDEVSIARKMNVSFGPTERPLLKGRAA